MASSLQKTGTRLENGEEKGGRNGNVMRKIGAEARLS
jgi:hypothetical protein